MSVHVSVSVCLSVCHTLLLKFTVTCNIALRLHDCKDSVFLDQKCPGADYEQLKQILLFTRLVGGKILLDSGEVNQRFSAPCYWYWTA